MYHDRPFAIFIDGENLSARMKSIELLLNGAFLRPGVKEAVSEDNFWSSKYDFRFFMNTSKLLRKYYYGSYVGDIEKGERIREQLQSWGIGETFLIKKENKRQNSKGVDIKLTVDMLSLAFSGKVAEILLVAMDADYAPLVQKVKSLGVRVSLAFPGLEMQEYAQNKKEFLKTIGLPKSRNYMQSFDYIYRLPIWFERKLYSKEELSSIWERIRPVIREYSKPWHIGYMGDDEALVATYKYGPPVADITIAISPKGKLKYQNRFFDVLPLFNLERRFEAFIEDGPTI